MIHASSVLLLHLLKLGHSTLVTRIIYESPETLLFLTKNMHKFEENEVLKLREYLLIFFSKKKI
jgi:hypothetical protein